MHYPRVPRRLLTFLVLATHATAQVITTLAGTVFTFPRQPVPALNAPLGSAQGVAVDAQGNVYVADPGNNLVEQIAPNGTLTVVAGNGAQGFSGDGGPATSASLYFPIAVAVDMSGNLYIADKYNDRIRMVSGGVISTIAGNGAFLYSSGDGGPATSSAVDPNGVAVDSSGNVYIADLINNRVRKVSHGIVTTIAGNGTAGLAGDGGPATSANLSLATAVAVDSAGNVYIADNDRIRKVSGGIITTIAGNGTRGFSGDGGPGTSAELDNPQGVAVDSAGNVYIAETYYDRIRELSGGVINTIAGDNFFGFGGDGGQATQAALYGPLDVAVDVNGNVYIADTQNNRVRKVTTDGIINTIGGNSAFKFSGDGGPAPTAALNLVNGVAVDSRGTVYIADTANNRIRSISGGFIHTVAGTGEPGYLSDGGPANRTNIYNPIGVTVDSAGSLYIADTYNNRIRKVTNGIITTIAGNGTYGFSGDNGPATSAELGNPAGVAVDSAGNVYIADTSNNRIRKVSGGVITTLVENLFLPGGVAVDAAGNVYIADSLNNAIRVLSGRTLTTIAGSGKFLSCTFSGDGGPAVNATLCRPSGIAVDSAGNIYVADQDNNRIREISGGIINTIAGTGKQGFFGDGGPPTSAVLNLSDENDLLMTNTAAFYSGVAVDSAGNVYIADTGNDRVRVILAQKPIFGIAPLTLNFSGESHGAPAPVQNFAIAAITAAGTTLSGVLFSATTDGSSANWLSVAPASGATPSLVQVTANPANLSPGTYQGTIMAMAPNATAGTPTSIAVTFTVVPGTGPSLSVDKTSFSFPYARSSVARSQSLTVSNTGTGTLNYSVAVSTNAGGSWLSVTPTSGAIQAGTPVALSVVADPMGLAPQTYTGQIVISSNGGNVTIPVTLAISSLNQAILLSQSGLSFTGISQGGIVAPQSFAVKNIGTGVASYTVTASTLSGGPSWLSATPGNGVSDASAGSAPTVQVSVNPASLAAGKYYGLVRVDAPGTANSPQVLSVFLQVLASGSDQSATVQPAQLVFITTAGAEAPGSQNLLLYNVTATGKTYTSTLSADPGLNLIVLPPNGTLDPQNPGQIVVQPFTTGLAAGTYHATLTLQFDDGRVIPAKIQVIVGPPGGAGSVANGGRAGQVCTPTKLIPTLTSLSPQFQVPAGPPISLVVEVHDDCTNPQASGSVTASFSNGDPPLTLDPSGRGRFEVSWNSGHAASQFTITVMAVDPVSQLAGTEQVTGGSQAVQDPPMLDPSGVVSSATAVSFSPVAPGGLITIYGSRLGDSTVAFSAVPLTTQLGDTQVIMAGQPIPLLYVSPTQINAVVPAGINVNAPQQVLVQRGSTYSVPVPVDVASAQPSLFAYSNGLVIAQAYRGSSPPFLVSTQAPATSGDVLVLYTAGLGATNPALVDGGISPVANTVSAATVSIGGQNAPVQYAGLTPGFVGLYQVNAMVPTGVPAGSAPVTISIAGQTSPPVSLPVR